MKKFLSVFCAIAMMATLIVPSYAAGTASFSVADAVAVDGQATITVSADLVDMYSMEYVIKYDSALTIAEKPSQVDFEDFDMTPGNKITANPYKVIFDTMDPMTVSGDAFAITFNAPEAAGSYPISIECTAFNDDDEVVTTINANVIVEAAAEPFAPADADEISADFGSAYAYIRENKYEGATSYELCVISALKNISGFANAKFEFIVAPADAVMGDEFEVKAGKEIVEAYKAFEFNGDFVDVAQLGDGFEYMVYDSMAFDAANADNVVWFRVVGETANGTVYGAWQSVASLAA